MNFSTSTTRKPDWLRASLLAGFVATFAMTVTVTLGYAFASNMAEQDGNALQRWSYGLANNRLTDDINDRFLLAMIANLVFGLLWALTYASLVKSSTWLSGAWFAVIPWVLSVTIFFPLAGAGFLGMDLDSGPLPVLGNLVAHLVFGSVLGWIYGMDMDIGLDGSLTDHNTAEHAERGAALGIAGGGLVGAVGAWFLADQFSGLASQPVIALAGALSGAAVGALIGSLIGMTDEREAQQQSTPVTRVSTHR